jgi:hypothetical protein
LRKIGLSLTISLFAFFYGANVVKNADFESGASAPSAWDLSTWKTKSQVEWVASEGVGGSHAVKLSSPDEKGRAGAGQVIEVVPNEKYVVSFSYRGELANIDGARLRITYFEKRTDTTGNAQFLNVTPQKDWKNFSKEISIPENIRYARIDLFIYYTSGFVIYDNVSVSPLNEAIKVKGGQMPVYYQAPDPNRLMKKYVDIKTFGGFCQPSLLAIRI